MSLNNVFVYTNIFLNIINTTLHKYTNIFTCISIKLQYKNIFKKCLNKLKINIQTCSNGY